jgi:hypothetical protein
MVEAADSKEPNDMLREAMAAKVKAKFPTVDVEKLSDEICCEVLRGVAADKPAPP